MYVGLKRDVRKRHLPHLLRLEPHIRIATVFHVTRSRNHVLATLGVLLLVGRVELVGEAGDALGDDLERAVLWVAAREQDRRPPFCFAALPVPAGDRDQVDCVCRGVVVLFDLEPGVRGAYRVRR